MEKSINNSLSNVAIIFETLCGVLTKAIVDKNEDLGKRVKHVIVRHLQKNQNLKEELELYRTISHHNFKDTSIGTAFVSELLRNSTHRKQKDIVEGITSLMEDIGKADLKDLILERLKVSETWQAYRNIEQMLQLRRQETRTLQESKNYYELLDAIVGSSSIVLEREQKSKEILKPKIILNNGKLNSRVLQEAVKVFQEQFGELSPSIKELIQDYLYYKKNDRFLHALAKRMRSSIGEAQTFIKSLPKTTEATRNSLETIVENMEMCYENIKKFSSQEPDQKKLFELVREVAEQLDLGEELKHIV